MNINDIVFQTLRSTEDGVGATTGKQTELAFNGNFEIVRAALTILFQVAAIHVSSETIKQLKYDSNTDSVFYSLDDESVPNPTWVPLQTVTFSNILGDPRSNIALNNLINSMASQSDFDTLEATVNSHDANLTTLNNTTATHTTQISTLQGDVTYIQGDMNNLVRTTTGERLWIRYVPLTNSIEYSTDNANWKDINDANVAFANLTGLPSSNAALVDYVTGQINAAITGSFVTPAQLQALADLLTAHTQDYNNPHQVTKAQVGLSNVDNYSAEDMPLSRAARVEFEKYKNRVAELDMNCDTYNDAENFEPEDIIYLTSASLTSEEGGGGDD